LQLDKTAIELVCSPGKERQLKRNERLLAAGEVSRYKVFVLKGLLKTYTISADGMETIFSFLPEQSWTSYDLESYHHLSPSTFHIAAIEPARLPTWKKRFRFSDYLLINK